MRLMIWIGIGSGVLLLFACSGIERREPSAVLHDSISGYRDTMVCMTPEYRLAPTLCVPPTPSGARMSRAGASSAHGQKLYHLYVSDPNAYAWVAMGAGVAPVGLTLVKESHVALPAGGDPSVSSVDGSAQTALIPGDITDLFVMMKIGETSTPDTDDGWVYATASPAGDIETIGLIESCIGCHEQADHDRLFGLAPATTVYYGLPNITLQMPAGGASDED